MKKILALLLSSVFAISVQAKERVTIVYSWSAADPAANFDRAIINEANQLQNKYHFLFEAKPGASGTVAANYTLTNANAVLATSSAFFIRPNFYPADSHDISKFQALMPKCVVTALITSSKYKNWKEVPTTKPLSIGVSGLGTTTHLIAEQIVSKYPNMQVVAFKSTSEALVNVLGGQIDFSVNFIGDVESWTKENSTKKILHVLGATGSQSMGKIPTLISQGFSSELSTMSPPHQYLAPATMSVEKTREIREILIKASKTPAVKSAYAIDQCQPFEMSEPQLQSWYQLQTSKWKTLTTGVKVK